MSELKELTERIRKYVLASVSESRYEHSLRVASMCKKLCILYGLDEELGYFAGISHDMCKNMTPESLLTMASRDGCPIRDIEKERPQLLHGRAASVKLQEDYGFHNKDVLEAISNHTFGKVGMCDMAKILFIADKVEPGREHVTDSYIKKLCKLSLKDMFKTVLQESVDYLTKKGKTVCKETEELLASL